MKKQGIPTPGSHRSFDEKFGKDAAFFGSRRRKPSIPTEKLRRLLLCLLAVAALTGAVMALSTLWRVTEVTAEDGTLYSAAVIRAYTGVEVGESMMSFDARAVAGSLKAGLPMLDDIKVRKHLGGRLSVSYTEIDKAYYTCHNGNYSLFSTDELEVRGVYSSAAEPRRVGATYVGLPESTRVRVGEKLTFINLPYERESTHAELVTYELETDVPEKEYAYVFAFVDALMATPLAPRVTGMELGDRYDLWFVLDGRIKVRVGSMDELDRKLTMAERSLADSEASGHMPDDLPVLVDVSDPARIIHRASPEIDLPAWAETMT